MTVIENAVIETAVIETENVVIKTDEKAAKLKATQKAYREKNAEKIKESKRIYNQANKEKIKEQCKEYYNANIKSKPKLVPFNVPKLNSSKMQIPKLNKI